jgi:phosphate-selective porin
MLNIQERRKEKQKDWREFSCLLLFSLFLLVPLARGEGEKEPSSLSLSHAFKLSGFTQFQYAHWDQGVDTFLIRRARLILAGDIFKNLCYKLQVDVGKSPILLEAMLDWSFSSYFSLRIGQFKVPFSQENLTSSSDLDTINRSQAEEKLCPGRDIGSQGRDIGAMVFGKQSILEYQLGVFNGSGINRADLNDQKDIGGRVTLHPIESLSVGAAFYDGHSRPDSESPAVVRENGHRTGLEISYVQSALSIKGEYILAKDDQVSKSGWYLQGGYFFMPKELQGIIRFDSYDKNKDSVRDRSDRLTLGLNWFFAEKTKLQINYERYKLESGSSNWALLAQFQAGF